MKVALVEMSYPYKNLHIDAVESSAVSCERQLCHWLWHVMNVLEENVVWLQATLPHMWRYKFNNWLPG